MKNKLFSLVTLSLMLLMSTASAQAQWFCAFTDCTGKDKIDRKGLCDAEVSPMFEVIYGPPPPGNACESDAAKIEYFTRVSRYVSGSEELVTGPSAQPFIDHGFGQPMLYTFKIGTYEQRVIGFPGKWWDGPVPTGYSAAVAAAYPFPIMATAQGESIKAGACVPKELLVKQVAPYLVKKNDENCLKGEDDK